MLIHALVILTSEPAEDRIMILAKSLEYHDSAIDNLQRRVKDSLGSKELTEDVGRVRWFKLKGEHLRTSILMARYFRVTKLMITV
jgi:hypothetical protein